MMQDRARASYYGRRIGNRIKAFEWYQLEWVDPDFKVMIIQRQITKQWYNIELYTYNGRPIKVIYSLSNGAIFNDLERLL